MQPYFRFRLRRAWRRQKRAVKKIVPALIRFAHRHIVRRWYQWRHVRRFALAWLSLMVLSFAGLWQQTLDLKSHYLSPGPQAGGTYVEGVVGEIPSLNPIFPENSVSTAVSELVFNGLFSYDSQGELQPELAKSWEVNEDGTVYTITLRDDVVWHDGVPLTAQDVAFTFNSIQLPDVRSPLRANWKDVQISAPDKSTVVFKLPNPFAPFLHSLTTGVLPHHILESVPPSQLRVAEYNQQPVGTGPFEFDQLLPTREELRFKANPQYFEGRPRLDTFVIKTAANNDELLQLYQSGQTTAISDVGLSNIRGVEELTSTDIIEANTTSQVLTFFKMDHEILKNVKVRKALTQATRPNQIVRNLRFLAEPATAPLLPEHLGYSEAVTQLDYNRQRAAQRLQKAGWTRGEDGIRSKDGKKLELTLVTQNNDTYPTAAATLQEEWEDVGVRLKVQLVNQQEFQQTYIRPRNYDLLLVGIKLGADSDVYPYWHSSQADDPGLNLSLYKSDIADEALEGGRTRHRTELRAAKYETFLQEWRDDAPAVALYRPHYFYAVRDHIFGVDIQRVNDPANRLHNVEDWTVQTRPTLKRLLPQSKE